MRLANFNESRCEEAERSLKVDVTGCTRQTSWLQGDLDCVLLQEVLPIHINHQTQFSNVFNNFINKETLCVPFIQWESIGHPCVKHLVVDVCNQECGKLVKMTHKLTDSVLHPMPVQRSNVKLANAAFHESIIVALKLYAENGHEEFHQAKPFLQLIFQVLEYDGCEIFRIRSSNKRWNWTSPSVNLIPQACTSSGGYLVAYSGTGSSPRGGGRWYWKNVAFFGGEIKESNFLMLCHLLFLLFLF